MSGAVRVVQFLVTGGMGVALLLSFSRPVTLQSYEHARLLRQQAPAQMLGPFGSLVGSGLLLWLTWHGTGFVGAALARSFDPRVGRGGRGAGSSDAVSDPFAPPAAPGDAEPVPAEPIAARLLFGGPRGGVEPTAGLDPVEHLTFGQSRYVPVLPESDHLDADDPHVVVLAADDPLLGDAPSPERTDPGQA